MSIRDRPVSKKEETETPHVGVFFGFDSRSSVMRQRSAARVCLTIAVTSPTTHRSRQRANRPQFYCWVIWPATRCCVDLPKCFAVGRGHRGRAAESGTARTDAADNDIAGRHDECRCRGLLEVDRLKIDRSFVTCINERSDDRAIAASGSSGFPVESAVDGERCLSAAATGRGSRGRLQIAAVESHHRVA